MITHYSNTISVTTSSNLLLDTYSGAAAAYSLRGLSTDYVNGLSPYACEVRNGSNDALNIGFVFNSLTGQYDLDTAALLSHCNGGNGFVIDWYDQSGNLRDAVQITSENQPQIVSSGSVILENGKPTIGFDGTSQYFNLNLTQAIALTNSVNKAVAIVSSDKGITQDRNRILFIGNLTQTRITFNNENANTFVASFNTFPNRVTVNFNTQQRYLVFGEDLNGTQTFYLNSTTIASNNFGGTTSDSNGAFLGYSTVEFYNGAIQEVIMYASNQSSSRTGIETNLNNFYSIY